MAHFLNPNMLDFPVDPGKVTYWMSFSDLGWPAMQIRTAKIAGRVMLSL
jgi:hypothetical protein